MLSTNHRYFVSRNAYYDEPNNSFNCDWRLFTLGQRITERPDVVTYGGSNLYIDGPTQIELEPISEYYKIQMNPMIGLRPDSVIKFYNGDQPIKITMDFIVTSDNETFADGKQNLLSFSSESITINNSEGGDNRFRLMYNGNTISPLGSLTALDYNKKYVN